MANEIQKTDEIKDFKEVLTDKVKKAFIDLLPEDKLDAFVNQVVQEFEETELKKLAMEVLRKHAQALLNAQINELTTPAWGPTGKQLINDELKQILIEAAPEMLANQIHQQAQMVLQNLRNY